MVAPRIQHNSSKTNSVIAPLKLDGLLDEQLLGLAKLGNSDAFDMLMERYSSYFTSVAARFVPDHEAKDIVQIAFFNIFRKIDTFQTGSNFKSWAYRIVTNAALMHLRKQRTRREVFYEASDNADFLPETSHTAIFPEIAPMAELSADRKMEASELQDQIAKAVEGLEPKYHRVFVLREYYNLSLIEISQELNLSIPAVKSRLHRARHFLKVSLAPYVGVAA